MSNPRRKVVRVTKLAEYNLEELECGHRVTDTRKQERETRLCKECGGLDSTSKPR